MDLMQGGLVELDTRGPSGLDARGPRQQGGLSVITLSILFLSYIPIS